MLGRLVTNLLTKFDGLITIGCQLLYNICGKAECTPSLLRPITSMALQLIATIIMQGQVPVGAVSGTLKCFLQCINF